MRSPLVKTVLLLLVVTALAIGFYFLLKPLSLMGGSQTLNNGSPVAFTIVAADSSLAAPGLFSITLSDGYNNSGSLLDGSIVVY